MEFAEAYALPTAGELGTSHPRENDQGEVFHLRWGRIRFALSWGAEVNLKVVLRVYRSDHTCEQYLVDTDPLTGGWNHHHRATRDFFLHPFPARLGRIQQVRFCYIVHVRGRSIPSAHEYVFMDGWRFDHEGPQHQGIDLDRRFPSGYRTWELDAGLLQRDVDWLNHHVESLHLVPKFTRGVPHHPFHPKRYLHDRIDDQVRLARGNPGAAPSIKVCVDCIDDRDFVRHLCHAKDAGVHVQCIVDWRKMTLTNSDSYVWLKQAGVDLLGVFCSSADPRVEVAPDMHNKFILFGDEDCLTGSFNVAFDRWWANWETGLTFRSRGVSRLLDNVFQSVRGGVIQRYGVDPHARFNVLYTFGRHHTLGGEIYRPHHAILSAIHRARHSLKLCLFLIGELEGEHGDSVVDALIHAARRGVDVQMILNGHVVRQGSPAWAFPMEEELRRPVVPAVERLRRAGIPVALAYGLHDRRIPYSPLHAKYAVIDDHLLLDGCFNWYNTSVHSHDLLVVADRPDVARPYLDEFHQIQSSFRVFW